MGIEYRLIRFKKKRSLPPYTSDVEANKSLACTLLARPFKENNKSVYDTNILDCNFSCPKTCYFFPNG